MSFAMLPQGVLPRMPVATSRRLKEQNCNRRQAPISFLCSSLSLARHIANTNLTGTIHGKNSLSQHGHGRDLGIPPLRARDFGWKQDFPGARVGMTALMGSQKEDHCGRSVWPSRARLKSCPDTRLGISPATLTVAAN